MKLVSRWYETEFCLRFLPIVWDVFVVIEVHFEHKTDTSCRNYTLYI